MIYTNRFINLISLLITIFIFLFLNFFIFDQKENLIQKIPDLISSIQIKDREKNNEEKTQINVELGNWYIEIPSINLKAPIAEGTTLDILNTKVGHFEETERINGNIGLAAHNRGYEFNFFENLKKVKKGEKIIYTYNDNKKYYEINKIEIIKNTDWSYLEKIEENKITLITCVENEPLYRRCVQAAEIEF